MSPSQQSRRTGRGRREQWVVTPGKDWVLRRCNVSVQRVTLALVCNELRAPIAPCKRGVTARACRSARVWTGCKPGHERNFKCLGLTMGQLVKGGKTRERPQPPCPTGPSMRLGGPPRGRGLPQGPPRQVGDHLGGSGWAETDAATAAPLPQLRCGAGGSG